MAYHGTRPGAVRRMLDKGELLFPGELLWYGPVMWQPFGSFFLLVIHMYLFCLLILPFVI